MFIKYCHLCLIIVIISHSIVVQSSYLETALMSGNSLRRAKSEQCLKKIIERTSMNYSYGVIDIFFSIAEKTYRRMKIEVDDTHLQILANITTAETSGDVIESVFLLFRGQFWPHLLLTIAFTSIFLQIICGFFYFCNQCCCKFNIAKSKDNNSCEISSRDYLLLLIGVQAVMMGLLLLSLKSIDYTFDNINTIDKFVRDVSEDVINVTKIIFDDVKCEMEMILLKLFDKIKHLLWQLPNNAFNHYKESDGYINMQSAINNLKNISWALNKTITSSEAAIYNINNLPPSLQAKMSNLTMMTNDIISYAHQINEHYNDVHQMNNTWNNLDELVFNSNEMKNILEESDALIDDNEKQAMKMVEIIYNGSANIIKFIRKSNQDMDNIREQYAEIQKYIELKHVLYLLIVIPVLSAIIPTVITVFCGMAKIFANKKPSSKYSKVFDCGRYFGLFALAAAFFIGWIVMLIASLSFITVYSIEVVWKPLFDDPEMRFYNTLPLFQFNIENPIDKKIFTTNIGTIIKKCRRNATILSVLEVERLINVDAIMKKMDIEGRRDRAIGALKNINFKQHFPKQIFNQLMEDSEVLEKKKIELHDFNISDDIAILNESLRDNFNYINSNISNLIKVITYTTSTIKQIIEQYLYSGEMINESTQMIAKESNYIIANIEKYFHDSTNYFRNNSYSCQALYDIWEDTGLTISRKISRPIQGFSLSTGLLAILLALHIIYTTIIVKYLARTDRKYDFKENSSENIITMNTTTDLYQ